jgi:hypothetical protein
MAVVALYLLTALFGVLGVVLGALAIEQIVRLRIVYVASIVLFAAIAAVSLKTALRNRWTAQLGGDKPDAESPTTNANVPAATSESGAAAAAQATVRAERGAEAATDTKP